MLQTSLTCRCFLFLYSSNVVTGFISIPEPTFIFNLFSFSPLCFLDDQIPDEYLCPISREIMKEPVIAAGTYMVFPHILRDSGIVWVQPFRGHCHGVGDGSGVGGDHLSYFVSETHYPLILNFSSSSKLRTPLPLSTYHSNTLRTKMKTNLFVNMTKYCPVQKSVIGLWEETCEGEYKIWHFDMVYTYM